MKKCMFCAEGVQDEAIVCKHCGKELDGRKVKAKSYRWTVWKILIAVFVGAPLAMMFLAYLFSGRSDTSVQSREQKGFQETVVTVESDEFDSLDVPVVNVWRSYSNRSLVTTVGRGDQVTLVGYDAGNDYCKVRTNDGSIGWFACGWIKDLPENLR